MSSNLDDSSPPRPQDPARSPAPDRSSPARRPDHRDKQVGQALSLATPLLSDGDIMGFNSPGQSTHKTTLVSGGERKLYIYQYVDTNMLHILYINTILTKWIWHIYANQHNELSPGDLNMSLGLVCLRDLI